MLLGIDSYNYGETKKSHSLPTVSWRPRKAGDVIQSEPEGLGTREAPDANRSRSQRWGGMSQFNNEAKGGASPFLCPLCYSGLSWLEGAHPDWGGVSAWRGSPIQALISARRTLTATPGNRVQFFRHPTASQVDTKWTITETDIPSIGKILCYIRFYFPLP